METTQDFNQPTEGRKAVITTLAVVGFLALIAIGIWLAIYSARFVPGTVSRIGTAAVSLTSIFSPAPSGLAVVSSTTYSTTIPFGDSTSTPTTTPSTTTTTSKAHTVAEPGSETSGTYPMSGTGTVSNYGLPEFQTTITSVGYMTTDSTSSFIPSSVVPIGDIPAVEFTIKNIGTNVTGPWVFSASVPTQTAFVFDSLSQQPLNPGDSVQYTLGFQDSLVGSNETVTVTANYNNAIAESSTLDNTATAVLNIQ